MRRVAIGLVLGTLIGLVDTPLMAALLPAPTGLFAVGRRVLRRRHKVGRDSRFTIHD